MAISAKFRELQTQSPQQWLERASQSVPQVLSVVLVIAIAWQLVQLTWLLFAQHSDLEPVTIAPPSPQAMERPKGIDVQGIVAAKLFGEAQTPVQSVENAPATAANLVLSAVFAAEDPEKGLAIIGESQQSAKVYQVGQTVPGGTRLHSVYSDRVILDRNGQLETLALPKHNPAGLTVARATPPAPRRSQFTDNLRRIAETNPTAFAEIVRPQPVFANGVQRGYRVYPGRNRQMFSKLGLRPGDLVLSINGTPLDDPQRGMEIFNTMGTSDRVQVTVEREGQTQELTLNTAQIMLPDPGAPSGAPPGSRRGAPDEFSPSAPVE